MQHYTHQLHAFSDPTTFTIEDKYLQIEPIQEASKQIEYGQIDAIYMQYDTIGGELEHYVTTLHTSMGRIKITNGSYQSLGVFTSHHQAYRDFIVALHQKCFEANPNIHYFKGTSKANYFLSLFIAFFIVTVLLFAIVFSFTHQFMGLVAVKVIVLFFALPYLVEYIKKNRPISYDPLHIPKDILPS